MGTSVSPLAMGRFADALSSAGTAVAIAPTFVKVGRCRLTLSNPR